MLQEVKALTVTLKGKQQLYAVFGLSSIDRSADRYVRFLILSEN
jgi:hypothetical protein